MKKYAVGIVVITITMLGAALSFFVNLGHKPVWATINAVTVTLDLVIIYLFGRLARRERRRAA